MVPTPPVPPALRLYVAARIPYDVDFGAPGVHRGLLHTTVAHAEWLWPEGGGIMFGSDTTGIVRNAGGSAVYLITSDPGAVFGRAVAAGATVVRALEDNDYGGRGGSVLDSEGNHWSFGSYQPS